MANIINKYVGQFTNKVNESLNKVVEDINITGETTGTKSLATFRNKLNSAGGVARSNLFMVSFELPSWMENAEFLQTLGITRFNEELGLLCSKVSAPTKSLQTQTVRYGNNLDRKIPTGYRWEEVTFTFIERNDYLIFNTFNEWIDGINNPVTNTGRFYDDTVSDVKINFLNKNGDILAYYTLLEARPSSVTISDYDWSQTNQYVTIDITFDYVYSITRDYSLYNLVNIYTTSFGQSEAWNTVEDLTQYGWKNLLSKMGDAITSIF